MCRGVRNIKKPKRQGWEGKGKEPRIPEKRDPGWEKSGGGDKKEHCD